MYFLSFEIPGLPDTPNRRQNASWQSTHFRAKKWKGWVGQMCLGKKPAKPLERSHLVLTRYSSVEPDPDNLAASFKPVIDGLRYAGVIENDRSANVQIQFSWKLAPKGIGKISVEVKEIEE